jgi:ATP-dependent protease ClpP protease subunit
MRTPELRIQMLAKGRPIIEIYDEIGPAWLGMIEEKAIAKALKEIGNVPEIEVRVNSLGGDAYDGLAIGNLFKAHPAKFHGRVMGVAASAATLLLMGCDTITIPKNALLMIHDPWTIAIGDVDDMQKAINQLEAVTQAGIECYAAKNTKKSKEEIAALMKEETWFTGEEAVEAGFADQTEAEVALPAVEPKAKAQSRFRKAPEHLESLFSISMRAPEVPTMADTPKPDPDPTPAPNPAPEPAPTPTPPPPPTPKQEAPELIERKRCSEIVALCSQIGRPEMAAEFIDAQNTVEQVRMFVKGAMCQDRKPVDGGGGGNDPTPADPNAKYKTEYAADRAYFQKSGTTEEDYIASRRITDGLDVLKTASAA